MIKPTTRGGRITIIITAEQETTRAHGQGDTEKPGGGRERRENQTREDGGRPSKVKRGAVQSPTKAYGGSVERERGGAERRERERKKSKTKKRGMPAMRGRGWVRQRRKPRTHSRTLSLSGATTISSGGGRREAPREQRGEEGPLAVRDGTTSSTSSSTEPTRSPAR